MPLVTIAICAYNAQRYIEETLESALAQTFRDFDVLVVDDGSTDDTPGIVGRMARRHSRLKYFRQENGGLSSSRNASLRVAEGQWLAIIDHDDICLPGRLEAQVEQARRFPDAALIFSDSEHFMDDGRVIRSQFQYFNPCGIDLTAGAAGAQLLVHGNFIDSETAFFQRKAAIELGGFDPRYAYAMDYEFFIRLGARFRISGVDRILSRWRLHPKQLTQTIPDKVVAETRDILSRWLDWPGLVGVARAEVKQRLFLFALLELRAKMAGSRMTPTTAVLQDVLSGAPTSLLDLQCLSRLGTEKFRRVLGARPAPTLRT